MKLSDFIDFNTTACKVAAAATIFGAGVVAGRWHAKCTNSESTTKQTTNVVSSENTYRCSCATKVSDHTNAMDSHGIKELQQAKANLIESKKNFEKRYADMKSLREMERKGRTQAEMALRRKVKEW